MANDIICEISSAGEIVVEINGMTYQSVAAELAGKASVEDVALKADKTYVDTQDSLKADKATTYTKTEVDTSLGLKADKLLATNYSPLGESYTNTGYTSVGFYSTFIQNHKYFCSLTFDDNGQPLAGAYGRIAIISPITHFFLAGGMVGYTSNISTFTAPTGYYNTNIYGSSAGNPTYIKNFMIINLTETFGAGKEPTKEQMDMWLSEFPNSWFSGTQELISLKVVAQLLDVKANKQQESWITPTLQNGWENYDVNSTVQYMKDSLGFVHFRGLIKTGVFGTVGFAMPAGYRPAKVVYFVLPTAGSPTRGYITPNGLLFPSAIAYATYISLDQITYRAEV